MLITMGQSGSKGVGGRRHRGPLLAVVVSGVFLTLLVATYAVKVEATGFTLDDMVFAISIVTAQAVGLLLAVRRPDNLVGWIVCGLAWSLAVPGALDAYVE